MTASYAALLGAAAFPFVVLFPDPPGFGPEALILLATVAIVATGATAWLAEWPRPRRILHRAAVLFAITAAATSTNILLHRDVGCPSSICCRARSACMARTSTRSSSSSSGASSG